MQEQGSEMVFECVTNAFALIAKGQKVTIRGGKVFDDDMNELAVDAEYIKSAPADEFVCHVDTKQKKELPKPKEVEEFYLIDGHDVIVFTGEYDKCYEHLSKETDGWFRIAKRTSIFDVVSTVKVTERK